MKPKLPERRRFIRVPQALKLMVKGAGFERQVVIKNISPVGIGFEIFEKIEGQEDLKFSFKIPLTEKDISFSGRVIWQHKTSLEDFAPHDVGVEITSIKEEDKNAFLKYICDLLYSSQYSERV